MVIIDKITLISYICVSILVYLIMCKFLKPLKLIIKILLNSFCGILLLLTLNSIGRFSGIYLGVNPLTAVTVGLMGVPGMLLMVLLNMLL